MADVDAATGHGEPASDLLPPDTRVEVRNDFDGAWARGFTVVAGVDGRYRLRRRSDDAELPGTFAPTEVRRERRRSTWWV